MDPFKKLSSPKLKPDDIVFGMIKTNSVIKEAQHLFDDYYMLETTIKDFNDNIRNRGDIDFQLFSIEYGDTLIKKIQTCEKNNGGKIEGILAVDRKELDSFKKDYSQYVNFIHDRYFSLLIDYSEFKKTLWKDSRVTYDVRRGGMLY